MPTYRMPAEWELHAATWLAWPWHPDWGEHVAAARDELVALCSALRRSQPGRPDPERLDVLVPDAAGERAAGQALGRLEGVQLHRMGYGDIWLRDTGPLFVRDPAGALTAQCFAFNGWGGKYRYPDDDKVGRAIATRAGVPGRSHRLVLEGGALEVDGEGTLLTTRQCLFSRNPGLDVASIEATLRDTLGAERVVWLDRGLARDHTDGHVDTLARFVRPGVVVCMEPADRDDPNYDVLHEIARDLGRARDARDRRLEVVRLPSPGRVLDSEGRVMPASYCNFYIANAAVVMPTYGSPRDAEALERLRTCFSDRPVLGAPAKAILEGGGAFHCITQQQPL